jgi:1-acyl-sn-glycerol-3-phosphate acyltransferase
LAGSLSHLVGAVSFLLYALNTVFWTGPLFAMVLPKLVIPFRWWRTFCGRQINRIANCWIGINNLNLSLTKRIQWDVRGLGGLKLNEWYLVVANHQSWSDILVLQKVFHRKIPFLKFFLKKELIWVPIMGLAWWALEFPFMKRYSTAFLKKHPHLRGKDLDITRRACEKFKAIPISVMNFVEGTRFTLEKHRRQESPFKNLLRPKAGGIAFVLSSMNEQMHSILNVTISYPQGIRSFWEFLCGKVREVRVRVESIPVPRDLLGDYFNDEEKRERFQHWLNTLWMEKDRCLESMQASYPG